MPTGILVKVTLFSVLQLLWKLTNIIAEEVGKKKTAADLIVSRDLKTMKSYGGKDVQPLLNHPFSAFYNLIGGEDQKELHVVFDKPTPPSKAKPASYADVLMRKANPPKTKFESKFTVEEVETFIDGHATASNKEKYLSNYPGKKPSLTDQHEAYNVSFLNKHKLTYLPGVGGEEKRAKKALSKLNRTVQFLTEHSDVISRGQMTAYGNCELLVNAKRCISAKAKPNAKKNLSQKLLQDELKEVDDLLRSFPSSWWKENKNSGERKGEAILAQVELMKQIIATHISRLHDQIAFNQDAKVKPPAKPSASNTEVSIIKADIFSSSRSMSEAHKDLYETMKAEARIKSST